MSIRPNGWYEFWTYLSEKSAKFMMTQDVEIASLYPRFVEPFDLMKSLFISAGWTLSVLPSHAPSNLVAEEHLLLLVMYSRGVICSYIDEDID